MIFWRIVNNQLHPVQETDNLGFEESEGLRIPDEYLDKQEFMVMRTAHGIGDWGIISAMPRLLKEKYPNCKVYVPSVNLLEKLFGQMKDSWGTWDNPFKNVHYIFDNNPYVDKFVDEVDGEIFHDHYRVYDKDKIDIPLTKQMLKFWQFTEEEYVDCTPELYFSDEERQKGDEVIKQYAGDEEFGGLLITSRFEGVSKSTGENYDIEGNIKLMTAVLEKCGDLPFFYYIHKKPNEYPFSFNKCLDMRHMDSRIQLYVRSKAKLNIGTHCGFLDCLSRYSKIFQIQRVFPLNHNVVEKSVYLNRDNYKHLISDDEYKVNLLKGLPDKTESKTTTSLKWKSDFIDYFRDEKYREMKILEIGSSNGSSTRILSFLFKEVTAIDTLSERHIRSSKLNYDRDNIEYLVMDVYRQTWDFKPMDVVFIDCVHDYSHVRSDIDNTISSFDKPIIVFDDYGLFPEVKRAVDEYIEGGVLELKTYLGMPAGTFYAKTQHKILQDWEGLICQVK